MIILPHGIYSKFQSTRPVRGATIDNQYGKLVNQFQSTRPVRGATPYYIRKDTDPKVSIHAPRAGRDYARQSRTPSFRRFNPRAPCGARLMTWLISSIDSRFNPRAPCGARQCSLGRIRRPCVSIHAPRAGRDQARWRSAAHHHVSIHAPRAGRDSCERVRLLDVWVSIHAPRAGRDLVRLFLWHIVRSFNPRAPCGARHLFETEGAVRVVSIHAPRAGRDISLRQRARCG